VPGGDRAPPRVAADGLRNVYGIGRAGAGDSPRCALCVAGGGPVGSDGSVGSVRFRGPAGPRPGRRRGRSAFRSRARSTAARRAVTAGRA